MNTSILYCGSCGARNRVPWNKADAGAKCGKCAALLDTRDLLTQGPMAITDASFQNQVLGAPLPVLLDCWAPWCGACRTVEPVIDELAGLWHGKIRVAKLNVDQNPQTAARFQIKSIPTLLIFDRGRLVETLLGALPKDQIARKMAPYLQDRR